LIDGVDVRHMSQDALLHQIGVVPQDSILFTGTVRDNIRYGNLSATDDEVVAAARMAYVDHFVRTLPQGYDLELTRAVSEAVRIPVIASGGVGTLEHLYEGFSVGRQMHVLLPRSSITGSSRYGRPRNI
jgi:ABC-type uncharacterized transport system ATPase subunit